jgi:hypothetical protein
MPSVTVRLHEHLIEQVEFVNEPAKPAIAEPAEPTEPPSETVGELGTGFGEELGDDAVASGHGAADVGGAIDNNFGTVNVGTSTFLGNTPDSIVGGYNDLGGNTGLP